MLNIFRRNRESDMTMEYPKVILFLCLYILFETRALSTTINGTDQSQTMIKQADQGTVQETKLDSFNSEKIHDDILQNLKKSMTNASVNRKKRCNCNHKNEVGTDKNKTNHMKCGNHNGHASSNCQNKNHGNRCGNGSQNGEAGNCGQGSNQGGSGQSGNGQTESSGYGGGQNKPQKGGNEGSKEEIRPTKIIDKLKNVKEQILKKN